MPRGLSAAVKNYTGPMIWAADVVSRAGVAYFFAEDALTFGGNTYKPYLRIASAPRFTRSLKTDSGELELVNSDLYVGGLLAGEDFEGASCTLKQLLLGLDQAVTILVGRLGEQQQGEDAVKFRLTSELDPAQIAAHHRNYGVLCSLRFSKKICGYDPATSVSTENLAERTANVFSSTTIGDTTLAMAVDAHKDRAAIVSQGTGKGQKRRIKSNTATTLTLYNRWAITPDGTSKFKVFTFANGAPKFLFTSTSSLPQATADVFTPRTIGWTGLAMGVDDHLGDLVRIISGTGSGQSKKIKTNSATTFTVDDKETDFAPVPDATSVFAVFFRACPKDFAPSCEIRARTERFDGFPTLAPIIQQSTASNRVPPGGGGDGRGGGDDRGRRILELT